MISGIDFYPTECVTGVVFSPPSISKVTSGPTILVMEEAGVWSVGQDLVLDQGDFHGGLYNGSTRAERALENGTRTKIVCRISKKLLY